MTNQQNVVLNFAESSLSASGVKSYALREEGTTDDNGQVVRPLLPCRNAVFFNTGSADIQVRFSGQDGYRNVPAGTIFAIEDIIITEVQVTNASTTTAASYEFELDSKDTQLSILKMLAGKE